VATDRGVVETRLTDALSLYGDAAALEAARLGTGQSAGEASASEAAADTSENNAA